MQVVLEFAQFCRVVGWLVGWLELGFEERCRRHARVVFSVSREGGGKKKRIRRRREMDFKLVQDFRVAFLLDGKLGLKMCVSHLIYSCRS